MSGVPGDEARPGEEPTEVLASGPPGLTPPPSFALLETFLGGSLSLELLRCFLSERPDMERLRCKKTDLGRPPATGWSAVEQR